MKNQAAMAEGNDTPSPLEAGAAINYFSNGNPSPEPGFVNEVTGDNDYTVQVQNPDDSTRPEENVGQRGPGHKPGRYIEPREHVGFEPPVIEEPAGEL